MQNLDLWTYTSQRYPVLPHRHCVPRRIHHGPVILCDHVSVAQLTMGFHNSSSLKVITERFRRLRAIFINWQPRRNKLYDRVVSIYVRCTLFHRNPPRKGRSGSRSRAYRHYLRIGNPGHRKALTKLLVADHNYGDEALGRRTPSIPLAERRCRLCRLAVETPAHVWLGCGDSCW
jgi:hypothetical protein